MTDDVEEIRGRQRAARHASSIPLLANALGLAFLTYGETADWWIYPQAFVPPVVSVAVLVAMTVQRRVEGVGTGRDGYGFLAVATSLVTLFPPGQILVLFLGPVFVLGLGLLLLGWRGRDPRLWAPGLGLLVVGPAVSLHAVANHVAFLGPEPGAAVLGICTAVLLALAAGALARERATGDGEEPDPLAHVDGTVHQHVRLGILVVLDETDDADLSYLRRTLGLNDALLGQHLRALLRHGHVAVSTSGAGRRRRTWVAITRAGRSALDLEVQFQRNLLAGHSGARKIQERRAAAATAGPAPKDHAPGDAS